MLKTRSSQGGFNIIEILVTLTVLEVTAVPLQRLPATLDELLDPAPLDCALNLPAPQRDRELQLRSKTSWGPADAIRAELRYEGKFRFVRSVDLKGFSDQDGVIEHEVLRPCPRPRP